MILNSISIDELTVQRASAKKECQERHNLFCSIELDFGKVFWITYQKINCNKVCDVKK